MDLFFPVREFKILAESQGILDESGKIKPKNYLFKNLNKGVQNQFVFRQYLLENVCTLRKYMIHHWILGDKVTFQYNLIISMQV